METTCGIFVVQFADYNADNWEEPKILAVHATHASWKYWSLPKGLLDPDESEASVAAARELEEETGLIVNPQDLEYLGSSIYKNRKKKLEAFWVMVSKTGFAEDDLRTGSESRPVKGVEGLRCRTLITTKQYPEPFPEVDGYRWMTIEEAEKRLHQTQKELIPNLKAKLELAEIAWRWG